MLGGDAHLDDGTVGEKQGEDYYRGQDNDFLKGWGIYRRGLCCRLQSSIS